MSNPDRFAIEHANLIARHLPPTMKAGETHAELSRQAREFREALAAEETEEIAARAVANARGDVIPYLPFDTAGTKALVRKLDIHLIPYLALIYL